MCLLPIIYRFHLPYLSVLPCLYIHRTILPLFFGHLILMILSHMTIYIFPLSSWANFTVYSELLVSTWFTLFPTIYYLNTLPVSRYASDVFLHISPIWIGIYSHVTIYIHTSLSISYNTALYFWPFWIYPTLYPPWDTLFPTIHYLYPTTYIHPCVYLYQLIHPYILSTLQYLYPATYQLIFFSHLSTYMN